MGFPRSTSIILSVLIALGAWLLSLEPALGQAWKQGQPPELAN
jgi:hypothetical protein